MLNKDNIKVFILLILVAFGIATGVALTINDISLGLGQADKGGRETCKARTHRKMWAKF